MNPIRIIEPMEQESHSDTSNKIKISELIVNTIQGEGRSAGTPAVFLRVARCSLNCIFCDTKEVWDKGTWYYPAELMQLFRDINVLALLENGHHLVITGGSPLLYQKQLINFIISLREEIPNLFIEIENEAVILPEIPFLNLINHWNNSPKFPYTQPNNKKTFHEWLFGDKMKQVIQRLQTHSSSDYKFVVGRMQDADFISQFQIYYQIRNEQILVMPMGSSRAELEQTRPIAFEIAMKTGWRISDRLHVLYWDKAQGV